MSNVLLDSSWLAVINCLSIYANSKLFLSVRAIKDNMVSNRLPAMLIYNFSTIQPFNHSTIQPILYN